MDQEGKSPDSESEQLKSEGNHLTKKFKATGEDKDTDQDPKSDIILQPSRAPSPKEIQGYIVQLPEGEALSIRRSTWTHATIPPKPWTFPISPIHRIDNGQDAGGGGPKRIALITLEMSGVNVVQRRTAVTAVPLAVGRQQL